jgi:hypothetical protein
VDFVKTVNGGDAVRLQGEQMEFGKRSGTIFQIRSLVPPRCGYLARMALVAMLCMPFAAMAQAPSTLGYEGRLAGPGGQPITGTLSITFRLYDVASGGTPLWSEVQASVPIDGGNLAVELGSVTPLPPRIFGRQLFLGIQIAGDTEMTPRPRLTAAPYALRARGVLQRTVHVPADGTAAANGAALLAAMAAITDATADSPAAIELDAGTYDLGASGLAVRSFVTVSGQGIDRTVLRSSYFEGFGTATTGGTVMLADDSAVVDLTAYNNANAGQAAQRETVGINATGQRARLERVKGVGESVGASPTACCDNAAGVVIRGDDIQAVSVEGVARAGSSTSFSVARGISITGRLVNSQLIWSTGVTARGLRGTCLESAGFCTGIQIDSGRILVDGAVGEALAAASAGYRGLQVFSQADGGATLRNIVATARQTTPGNAGDVYAVRIGTGANTLPLVIDGLIAEASGNTAAGREVAGLMHVGSAGGVGTTGPRIEVSNARISARNSGGGAAHGMRLIDYAAVLRDVDVRSENTAATGFTTGIWTQRSPTNPPDPQTLDMHNTRIQQLHTVTGGLGCGICASAGDLNLFNSTIDAFDNCIDLYTNNPAGPNRTTRARFVQGSCNTRSTRAFGVATNGQTLVATNSTVTLGGVSVNNGGVAICANVVRADGTALSSTCQ